MRLPRLKSIMSKAIVATVFAGLAVQAPAASAQPALPSVPSVAQLQSQWDATIAQVQADVEKVVEDVTADVKAAVAPYGAPTPPKEAIISQKPVKEFEPMVEGPNYHWKDDVFSMVAAQKTTPVLHRVPGSYYDQPDIPEESVEAEKEGYSLYGPSTPIYVGGDQLCTVAVTGVDDQGRNVALTAGHCGEVGDYVESADSWRVGQTGTVVAVGDKLDYSVIELNDQAKVTNSYNGVTITKLGGKKLNTADLVCKRGLATGRTCGFTWTADEKTQMTQVCAAPGDSGAPLVKRGRLVGMVSGGLVPGSDFICRTPWQGFLFMPTISTNMDAVVDDLNENGDVGRGFKLVRQ